jgi:hypothetical protein
MYGAHVYTPLGEVRVEMVDVGSGRQRVEHPRVGARRYHDPTTHRATVWSKGKGRSVHAAGAEFEERQPSVGRCHAVTLSESRDSVTAPNTDQSRDKVPSADTELTVTQAPWPPPAVGSSEQCKVLNCHAAQPRTGH